MKPVFLALLFVAVGTVAAACGSNSKPADQPPGESAPGSPGSAWTTPGGPATPGVSGTGATKATDGGTH